MNDQENNFREALVKLISIAKKNGNVLMADQVREAFQGQGIDDGQMRLIFSYLEQSFIDVYDDDICPEPSGRRFRRPVLEVYLEELDKIASISQDEEFYLFEMARLGDIESSKMLVERYLPVACDLAGEFEKDGIKIEPEDMVQEANMGLLIGIKNLVEEDSLAAYRVKLLNFVTKYLENSISFQERLINSDKKILDRLNRLAEEVHALENELDHKPSIDELSACLDITAEEIRDMLRIGGENLDLSDI